MKHYWHKKLIVNIFLFGILFGTIAAVASSGTVEPYTFGGKAQIKSESLDSEAELHHKTVVKPVLKKQGEKKAEGNNRENSNIQENGEDAEASEPHPQDIVPQQAIKPVFTGKKIAYLTFDDGPSKNTPELLDILKEENIKASFFIAALSEDTPLKRSWIKRESDEGHTIGIHSWTHDYKYIYSSESNFKDDFDKVRDMIVSVTGKNPKFMRFPGGTDNTVSLKINNGKPIMPLLLQDVTDEGYIAVDWNSGGMDAVAHVPSKEFLAARITAECSHLNIAIILLHDSAPHKSSVEAVPIIVQNLKAMGFSFEPLTESGDIVRRSPAVKFFKN